MMRLYIFRAIRELPLQKLNTEISILQTIFIFASSINVMTHETIKSLRKFTYYLL